MLMTPPNNTSPFASAGPRLVTVPASQDDIERRILEVRSGWDVQERIRRRRAAKERFGQLVETVLFEQAN